MENTNANANANVQPTAAPAAPACKKLVLFNPEFLLLLMTAAAIHMYVFSIVLMVSM